MAGLIASLLLATAVTATNADRAALEVATHAIYAPYRSAGISEGAAWDRDIWSREVRQLITHWQSVLPENEPDALNGADWLCQCQDWDSSRFSVKIRSFKLSSSESGEVVVSLNFGHGARRDAEIVFRHEDSRWLVDDMRTEDYPEGIKSALRQTILDDEALVRARK